MKYQAPLILSMVGLIFGGCETRQSTPANEVITQRFIHKYGYDVSKHEWESKDYPGQVVTTFRNGVTETASFEDGQLHGMRTVTYPHSQTLETKEVYQRNALVKRTSFDIRGIPIKEEQFMGPEHQKTVLWYSNGSPRAEEELQNDQLVSANYYSLTNEIESKIENGSGLRTLRNSKGQLLSKETINQFELLKRETYHSNGTPEMTSQFRNGLLDGEKILHAESGEPISKEHYKDGVLHGPATYFQNGYRYLEVPYQYGMKDGIERHYIDGDTISEETEWHLNRKHGPTLIFYDGMAKTHWYYNDERVPKGKYDELCSREEEIAIQSERAKTAKNFNF